MPIKGTGLSNISGYVTPSMFSVQRRRGLNCSNYLTPNGSVSDQDSRTIFIMDMHFMFGTNPVIQVLGNNYQRHSVSRDGMSISGNG